MKKIYFVIVSVMLLFSGATAKAQYGTGEKVLNTVEFIYSPVTLSANAGGVNLSFNLNAIGVDWTQSYSIMQEAPVYLLYGGTFQYSWGAEDFNDKGLKFFTVTIPLSIAYDFVVPQTNVSVLPYAGLNVYDHVVGKSGSANLFDKDDMGGEPFEDFGIGWQLGAKVVYKNYILGVGYQGPISNLYSNDSAKINLSQVNLSVGIRF